jgi:tryptophan 2,3-dioxygenase
MSFGLPHGGSAVTYGEYLKIRELTSLQQLRSDPPHHDETLFIVIHQVYELWFKEMLHDLDGVLRRMENDEVLPAHRLLSRCIEIQRVLIQQVSVLETMTPMDFLAFRDHLRPASGFQSAQFREIEYLAGLKEVRHLENYAEGDPERGALQRRLQARSLRDAFDDLLRRAGFDLPPVDAGDGPAAEAARRRRLDSLMRIYREAEAHYPLFLLAESLIEFDERFTLWRIRHVQMVERVIGGRPGTGGSEGAAYLRGTVERRFFPELWEIRSLLGAPG